MTGRTPKLSKAQSVLPTVEVTLGERKFTVRPLPSGRAREWRIKLMEPLEGLVGLLGNIKNIEFEKPADLLMLIPIVKDALIGSVDLVVDSVLAYSPEIQEAWDDGTLKEEAYDEQFIDALVEVLKLAYPLAKVMKILPTGRSAPTTSQKLPAANGDSPTVIPITKAS